jgi:transcriptional regulator of acetoin/glycerol metabolism
MSSLSRLAPGKRAWDLYFSNDFIDRRLVRPEIASSWQRCRELQVNPLQPPKGAANSSFDDRVNQRQQLCRIARPFMRDLCYFISGTDFEVILADEDGLILEVLGDNKIVCKTKDVDLCPGSTWSEARKGTNAIGTALVERKPVQIFAWEHYCQENHFLTCSAAPIRDTAGKVIGVVDLSGDCRCANPHTLGMVVAVAKAIENQFCLEQANHKLYIAMRYSDALLHNVSEGLLAVDSNGIVTEMNGRGGEIFGIHPNQAKGRRLDLLCGGPAPLLQVLANGEKYEDREVTIEKLGRKVRSSASPVCSENGQILGAVAVFHEIHDRTPLPRGLPALEQRHGFEELVGFSSGMNAAKEWAKLASANCSTVLILGESGTGKELFAQAIHTASSRSDRPFVAINCAALPAELIESELFGYTDGSFTGAKKGGQAGKFEMANGGTVFLDEIGDMSLAVQAKLLRVIQERKVSRIGSAREVPIDIRIIAATHKDLSAEVERGTFREDLYYRLTVLEICVPPLRERLEDIPELARCLTVRIACRLKRPAPRVEESFLDKLGSYSWPGNVRELENVIERAMVRVADGDVLDAAVLEIPGKKRAKTNGHPPGTRTAPSRIRPLKDVEKDAIAEALSVCGGNILQAAARLGIARNTLYRKMEEFQLMPR